MWPHLRFANWSPFTLPNTSVTRSVVSTAQSIVLITVTVVVNVHVDEKYKRRRGASLPASSIFNKNSSGDEIANVNFFNTISHTYFKIPKKTYFV